MFFDGKCPVDVELTKDAKGLHISIDQGRVMKFWVSCLGNYCNHIILKNND